MDMNAECRMDACFAIIISVSLYLFDSTLMCCLLINFIIAFFVAIFEHLSFFQYDYGLSLVLVNSSRDLLNWLLNDLDGKTLQFIQLKISQKKKQEVYFATMYI